LIGSMKDEMRPFLAKFSSSKVFHKGPFPESELHRHYGQGSVFCLASIEEELAHILSEAMALRTSVICTTDTGGKDMLQDGQDGFIVPIRNVEALKERLLFFYTNRDACKEMRYSAQQRAKSDYTWLDYGNRMIGD
jgi:glycosyltransferase involved in cell wall biosynthesis